MNRLIYAIDQLSKTVGHVFAWCIIILTLGTTYEVFVRYVLDDPTSWAFDFSYIMYGALFFMAGAYTLSRGGHVRADMFYRLWRPRTQATVELVLYVLFFFPGVIEDSDVFEVSTPELDDVVRIEDRYGRQGT